jgi:transposase
MSRQRTSMRKLKEVYRLKFELNYSNRVIAQSVNLSASTISDYLRLFQISGLNWSDIAGLENAELENRLYGPAAVGSYSTRPKPEWEKIHLEMKRKGVTLQLLWREYKTQYPNGLGYTQFAKLYAAFCKTADPVMRFTHKAGEKTFVDYSGLKMEWIDSGTGEIHKAEIFVGCLGASHLIYAEATASQSLPDWIGSHVRMFEFFGGVSEMIVPDNLKSGVTKAHRYDPDINATYTLFAEHYAVAVVPTRIISPRDKAKAESGVQIVERQIIAVLRHRTFTSLAEINNAIAECLHQLNRKPMQRINLSRQEQFEQIEKAALKPLPAYRFELQEWKKAKVHIDYHICINKHFYSVPCQWIGKHVDVCLTKVRVEIFYQSQRIAMHPRNDKPNQFTTLEAHMPPHHRHYHQEQKDASIQYLSEWANQMGEVVAACIAKFFQSRIFPQHAIRAILGLKRLAKQFGNTKFEAACKETMALGRYRYQTVESILKHGLKHNPSAATKQLAAVNADHFRGPNYYQ